jgi:hypothetical protein
MLGREVSAVQSMLFFLLAAFFEIAGCFAFWAWLRAGRQVWVVLPGIVSLDSSRLATIKLLDVEEPAAAPAPSAPARAPAPAETAAGPGEPSAPAAKGT